MITNNITTQNNTVNTNEQNNSIRRRFRFSGGAEGF
jgi:hypothetical protein